MTLSKEKLTSLTKYQNELKAKLKEPVPEKHKTRPNEYRQFIQHELNMVTRQLEKANGI